MRVRARVCSLPQVLPPGLLSVVQAAAAEAEAAAAAAGPEGDAGALPAPDTGAYGAADGPEDDGQDALLRWAGGWVGGRGGVPGTK